MNVALYGATKKPHRYAYQAFQLLRESGHTVYPIHPVIKEIDGVRVYRNLAEIDAGIDTLTMYVGPQRQEELLDDILNTPLKRVVFNPGTENPSLQQKLQERGVAAVEGCTLVMLKTGQWENS